MEPVVHAFWVPKLGNSAEEYEDAFAFSATNRHLAIADGATESSFADKWAQALTTQYVTSPPQITSSKTPFPGWLAPLQQKWREGIDWDNLPWFAEEKAKTGAFATFLGVSIFDPAGSRKQGWFERTTSFFRKHDAPSKFKWQAVAVGDSCFFQIRQDQMINCFPLSKSSEFNSRPVLLCSNPANNNGVWEEVRFQEGECLADDLFVLATDAVAKWFFEEHEAGRKPWETLGKIASNADFENFIARLRTDKLMRNDDVTVLMCAWKAGSRASRTMFFRKS